MTEHVEQLGSTEGGIAYWVGWGPRAHLDSTARPTLPPAEQAQPQPVVFCSPLLPHLPQMPNPVLPQQVIQFQVQLDQVLAPVGALLLLVQNPIVLGVFAPVQQGAAAPNDQGAGEDSGSGQRRVG